MKLVLFSVSLLQSHSLQYVNMYKERKTFMSYYVFADERIIMRKNDKKEKSSHYSLF